jgi:hypothetical protein
MAVSDKKKVATAIAVIAREALKIRASVARMQEMRAAFVAAAPNVTGTPLQGQTATVSTRINALDAEINSAFWSAVIAADVPSHRGEAL